MPKPDFSPWSPHLSPGDLAAALAAAGVLWKPGVRGYPFSDDVDELVGELLQELPAIGETGAVRWSEPTFLTDRTFVRHTRSRSLADAWKSAVSQRGWPGILLEAEVENPRYLAWYARTLVLTNETWIRTFYVRTPPASAYLDWRWPLRIAFLSDTAGRAYRERFQAWLSNSDWAQGILRLVDPQASGLTADILFLPDAHRVLPALQASRVPVLANCLFAFGRSPAALSAFAQEAPRYGALTQAKALVFARAQPAHFEGWLEGFFRELSHNQPFDRALRSAAWRVTGDAAAALLFGSQFFIKAALPVSQAERLVRELNEAPSDMIDLGEIPSSRLGLSPGPHAASAIGAWLQANMGGFQYDSERDEATTISTLSLAAEQLVAQSSPAFEFFIPKGLAPEPKRIERFLQHQLEYEGEPPAWSVDLLTAGHRYHLSVRIGPQEAAWRSVERSFPEEKLPKTDRGHLLTVVFTEPKHLPEPQVATIFLPAAGPSTSCDFRFAVSPEYDVFEGRVIVLHGNRVLQTALLRSPVLRPEAEVHEGRLEFRTEGVVRPLASGLNGRTAYDAAFVFNHASDGEWTGTRLNGLQAATISLAGVRDTTDNITSLFNASDWEGKRFDRLDSAETVELLRNLALHGAKLYRAIVTDAQAPEQLLNAERIQVVMAREDYHLPVEFCYQRRPPKSTATLCPHAAEQLGKPELGAKCLETCTTKDQERDTICPLAFWGLNRVIEWHQFRPQDRGALAGGDYRLTSEPTQREGRLDPLKHILVGASDRIKAGEVDQFSRFVRDTLRIQPVQVLSWDEWEDKIEGDQPETLVLMVHTEIKQRTPSMEINGEFLDPPDVDESRVRAKNAGPPLVLLLGCETRGAAVPIHGLAAEFRMAGAAIVVSTLAELLDDHAPRLARAILAELANPVQGQRSFGDVLLSVKRKGLLSGLPIALALVGYGDADWEV